VIVHPPEPADPTLVAYVDPLSVAPGDELRLMVSAGSAYDLALLRLVHGARDPRGPGVREQEVDASWGRLPGRPQRLPSGSYLWAPASPALDVPAFTVTAWVLPTLAAGGRPRAIVARRDAAARRGWALGLDGEGRLAAWAGGASEPLAVAGRSLAIGRWSFVGASFSPGQVTLTQAPVPDWPVGSWRDHAAAEGPVDCAAVGLETTIAAWWSAEDGERVADAHFNGRIDRPSIFAGAAGAGALAAGDPDRLGLAPLARWRPGRGPQGTVVEDGGPHRLHARTVNTPARGVPGCNWSGREVDFRLAPDEYDAVHFHDDDLTDAGWQPDLVWRVPRGLRSGIYAFRLTAGAEELRVPFFVRPPRGTAAAPAAVLVPTLTYLAYANVNGAEMVESAAGMSERRRPLDARHRWAARHKLCSLYDRHRDGSGAYYASRRRPLVTITPDHVDPFIGSLWNLSADLCLIDWLEHEGIAYDVLTDEDLHGEGRALLERYRVVMTGTHPEYVTREMLEALEGWLAGGGRLMYLGGNGFYWVTAISPAEPHVIEIRRGPSGSRAWEVGPGELHLSSTGEPGGLWRHRGWAPQRLVGVGFTSQGGGQGRPYEPCPQDPAGRGAFVLAGVEGRVDADGLNAHAPAGVEIDRADPALGTPPHAVVLASARGFSDRYQHVIEEVLVANSRQGGSVEPRVRADLVFFETPGEGAVFSTGSIAWCTCLAAGGYDNSVARVTGNVLRRFLGAGTGS
jgi:N,N-dimethylformamidase